MNPPARALLAALCMSAMPGQAADYLRVLPDAAQAHVALDRSPQISIARARVNIGRAERQRVQGGSGEWEVSVTNDQRTDALGERFQEQQYGLSRRLRWPNKYLLDQRIGNSTTEVAEYAFEDAWHEAGRRLLDSWFSCLRAQRHAMLLGAQAEILDLQLRAVRQRVSAGDAPVIEQSQAEAELDRSKVLYSQATQTARSAELTLLQEFPDITPPDQMLDLDLPQLLQDSDAQWLARIVGENHEIKLADGEAGLAKLRAERAGQERLPDPTVGLRYTDNLDGNRKVLGLTLTLPLGGSARRSDYAEARSLAGIAEQTARAARLKVESDGRRDLLNARASYTQWQHLQTINEHSTRNAEILQRGYTLGEFSYGELQAARRQALEAAALAQTAQLDTLQAHARLQIDAHLLWVPDEDEAAHPGE